MLQDALAKCFTDPTCIQDLVCLQGCAGKEDETACQVIRLSFSILPFNLLSKLERMMSVAAIVWKCEM